MRKATTIVRMIDELEKELYDHYNNDTILEAIEKEEKKRPFYPGCCLVGVIHEGAIDYMQEVEDRLKEE